MGLRNSFVALTAARCARKRDAGRIVAFCACWTATHAIIGHRPTVEEYAEDWGMSRATAYREQTMFREVWPEFFTPSDLASALGLDPLDTTIPGPVGWGDPLAAG